MGHRLLPGVRVLRRGPGSVQIGSGTSNGLVLDGLDTHEIAFLESLQADSPRVAAQPRRSAQLLRLLVDAGQCAPARATTPDPALDIVLTGTGELTAHLESALTTAGHHVHAVASKALRPDLAVLTGIGGVPFVRAEVWRTARVPHLPVTLDGREVRVGPLAFPGGPCLRCVDLWRSDADPAWPALLAQVAAATSWSGLPTGGSDVSRIALAVALTTGFVEEFAAGTPASSSPAHIGGPHIGTTVGHAHRAPTRLPLHSLTCTYPDWTITRERWPQHPRCPAHAFGAVPPETLPTTPPEMPPEMSSGAATATMGP